MTSTPATTPAAQRGVFYLPLPLSVSLLLGAVALALAAGFPQAEVVARVNAGFGRALGDFALLLLPAFVIAGALAKRGLGGASGFAVGVSPLIGAGMVCPDTAYATLSPLAGRRRLITALGAYAGFKLLFPAGPLIVATGLGLAEPSVFLWGLALLPVVWGAGLIALWLMDGPFRAEPGLATAHRLDPVALAPFALIAILLILGATTPLGHLPPIDFLVHPRGALLLAALAALFAVPPGERHEVMTTAVRRTAGLLFVIGTAAAFGALLTTLVPLTDLWPREAGPLAAVLLLFGGAMAFKLIQGSSMATFAAVTAVAGPIVAAAGLSPPAAVLAICLGTIVAVTPNDSFYWLVRSDALADRSEGAALRLLGFTTLAQGLAGLILLLGLVAAGAL
jgi:GntP family gluconate:H+ symporter